MSLSGAIDEREAGDLYSQPCAESIYDLVLNMMKSIGALVPSLIE